MTLDEKYAIKRELVRTIERLNWEAECDLLALLYYSIPESKRAVVKKKRA